MGSSDLAGRSALCPTVPFPRSSQMPRRKEVPALGSLCLQSLARHMQNVWVKDYSENYLDEYQFRYVMGPFNDLGETRGPGTPSARRRRRTGERCRGSLADPRPPHHPPQPAAWCRT